MYEMSKQLNETAKEPRITKKNTKISTVKMSNKSPYYIYIYIRRWRIDQMRVQIAHNAYIYTHCVYVEEKFKPKSVSAQ